MTTTVYNPYPTQVRVGITRADGRADGIHVLPGAKPRLPPGATVDNETLVTFPRLKIETDEPTIAVEPVTVPDAVQGE